MSLRLKVTDWIDATRWRWLLEEQDGSFVADHTVCLDPASVEYRGFCDLARYIDYHAPVTKPREQLLQLGAWIGEQVFGGLRTALRERARLPAEAVQVLVPETAHALLERPFEIACFADGKRFDTAGVRLVYQAEAAVAAAKSVEPNLRLLAVFSLPVRANPLNLRRERYQLQQLVRRLQQTQGLAVELRVLQYGATRQTLREALEEADGWDVVHLSGHGQRGELLLETDDGSEDPIDTVSLGDLLEPARDRLKLLLLDACYSGAASHAAARVQVGLDAARDAGTQPPVESDSETLATPLPSLGHALAGQLDCAVLAMRYPVGDGFATELMLALYEKLLDKHQRLPAALQLALRVALSEDLAPPVLAELTPVLLGTRSSALKLVVPKRAGPITLSDTGLGIGFPPQPQRFVGRLQPMLRAGQTLAPNSPRRAVLFHGMPGAGKSACALELAYRHEQGRFIGHVWYQAPEVGSDIASALFNLLHAIQRQLNAPDLGLTTALDDSQRFRQYTLPRLRTLLEQNALLLVLDNLETLLTESDQWRVPLWGEVLQTLLAHQGLSRVVLTSRRVPVALAHDERAQVEPIHALSFAESVLLARELPRLRTLFVAEADHALLRQTLRVVQGHPKLMELADGLAAERAALQQRVNAAEAQLASSGELLDAFFAKGGAREGQSQQQPEQFMRALQGWTSDVLARLTPTAQRLFGFLCRLESEDRAHVVVQATWDNTLARLEGADAAAVAARAEPGQGVNPALQALQDAGLVDVTRPGPDAPQTMHARYGIHPGVAEAAVAGADAALLQATDIELGNFFQALVLQGLKTEGEGEGGGVVVTDAARRGVPYLMRTQRWQQASTLLERLLHRDQSSDTITFALPLLERIAAATVGSERELIDQGNLANALAKAGRRDEAETRLRDVIDRARASGKPRIASAAGSDLMTLLWDAGRLDEALRVVEAMAEDTRNAGLGPWTQLADEAQRLQLLNALGRYDEVREAVERLRPMMAALPETSEVDEAVEHWNVREGLLSTGHVAALHSERWEVALVLNEEIRRSERARGAGALGLARTRFNNYAALLRLGRFDDARALLLDCREVFEAERDRTALGSVFSALADLEDKTGASDKAADFERVALGYRYQVGDPEGCGVSHHNLANYMTRSAGDPAQALAHRLADAVLCLQTRSGGLSMTLKNLARQELPPALPTFSEVVAQVEAVPGVRLAALFGRLPRTFADGDAALAAICQMTHEEKDHRAREAQALQTALAAMPTAVQAAFELEGEAFSRALRAALLALPGDEAAQILQRLREAGLIGGEHTERDRIVRLLEHFEPMLQDIAAVARGDNQGRAALEALLPDLDGRGFRLAEPVRRIWAGERNELDLSAGLDAVDARLLARLLEILSQSTGE